MKKFVHVLRDSVTGNTSDFMSVDNVSAFARTMAVELAQAHIPASFVRDSALYLVGFFDTDTLQLDPCIPSIAWRGDDSGFAEMVKMAAEALYPAASSDPEAPASE